MRRGSFLCCENGIFLQSVYANVNLHHFNVGTREQYTNLCFSCQLLGESTYIVCKNGTFIYLLWHSSTLPGYPCIDEIRNGHEIQQL